MQCSASAVHCELLTCTIAEERFCLACVLVNKHLDLHPAELKIQVDEPHMPERGHKPSSTVEAGTVVGFSQS